MANLTRPLTRSLTRPLVRSLLGDLSAAGPTITTPASFSGIVQVGQVVTGDDGAASGVGPVNVTARRWVLTGAAIPGATNPTFAITDQENLGQLAFEVDHTDDNGTTTSRSAPVQVTYPAPVALGGLPALSFDANTGIQFFDVSVYFTGQDLDFAIAPNPDPANITMDETIGLMAVDTDAASALSLQAIAFTATNSGGTANDNTTYTLEAVDVNPPVVNNYAFNGTDNISAELNETGNVWVSVTPATEIDPDNIENGVGASYSAGPFAFTNGQNDIPIVLSNTDGAAWLNIVWRDAAGNPTVISQQYTFPDTTPPNFLSGNPADDATGVSPTADLVLTFDDDVAAPTAGGEFYLYAGAVLVETFDSDAGTGDNGGTIAFAGQAVTLSPGAAMATLTAHNVEWNAAAVEDTDGNPVAANTSDTTYNFTTAAGGSPPVFDSANSSPNDGATGVAIDDPIVVAYDKTVVGATAGGEFYLYAGGVLVETFDVDAGTGDDGGTISISGTDVTLTPGTLRTNGATYSTRWNAGAVEDTSGNPVAVNAGNTLHNFTIVALPTPQMVTFDGTTPDYWDKTSGFTGAADSQHAAGYFKFNLPDTSTIDYLMSGQNEAYAVRINGGASGDIEIRLENSAGTILMFADTTTTGLDDGADHEIWWSYDGVTGTSQLYLDGSDDLTDSVSAVGTMDFTLNDWSIGAYYNGAAPITGGIARHCLWVTDATGFADFDISVAAVRARMADHNQASAMGNGKENIWDVYGTPANWNAAINNGWGGNTNAGMNGAVT